MRKHIVKRVISQKTATTFSWNPRSPSRTAAASLGPPFLGVRHTLKHITRPPQHARPTPTTRPPYRPSEERAGPCVQNESALFVVLFRARAVSSSPLEMARAELTLIISDPGERRALSLHTIKAAELPWRTCFSVNRGSQSTHTHTHKK